MSLSSAKPGNGLLVHINGSRGAFANPQHPIAPVTAAVSDILSGRPQSVVHGTRALRSFCKNAFPSASVFVTHSSVITDGSVPIFGSSSSPGSPNHKSRKRHASSSSSSLMNKSPLVEKNSQPPMYKGVRLTGYALLGLMVKHEPRLAEAIAAVFALVGEDDVRWTRYVLSSMASSGLTQNFPSNMHFSGGENSPGRTSSSATPSFSASTSHSLLRKRWQQQHHARLLIARALCHTLDALCVLMCHPDAAFSIIPYPGILPGIARLLLSPSVFKAVRSRAIVVLDAAAAASDGQLCPMIATTDGIPDGLVRAVVGFDDIVLPAVSYGSSSEDGGASSSPDSSFYGSESGMHNGANSARNMPRRHGAMSVDAELFQMLASDDGEGRNIGEALYDAVASEAQMDDSILFHGLRCIDRLCGGGGSEARFLISRAGRPSLISATTTSAFSNAPTPVLLSSSSSSPSYSSLNGPMANSMAVDMLAACVSGPILHARQVAVSICLRLSQDRENRTLLAKSEDLMRALLMLIDDPTCSEEERIRSNQTLEMLSSDPLCRRVLGIDG
eukprot:ANDGO_04277.mRNA.1 hypothetical protein